MRFQMTICCHHELWTTMRRIMTRWQSLAFFFGALSCLVIYNEFLVYYIVLIQCTWPVLDSVIADFPPFSSKPLKAMLLADTHLLGSREGHWFDKLRRCLIFLSEFILAPLQITVLAIPPCVLCWRLFLFHYREWQMERAFQTAMTIHSPDIVFVLGLYIQILYSSKHTAAKILYSERLCKACL